MSAAIGTLKIKLFDGKENKAIPVPKSTATIGSADHCDLVLGHDTVQAEHVRVWIESGRIWIQDLGTSSGSFLNGIRLPVLKPMLVRELDILKLGDCPATVSLEAVMIRAPIVRAAVPSNDFDVSITEVPAKSSAKDEDLEKKREELGKVRRELAELRLQLQMGQLEKVSSEELRRQVNALREELRALGEQRTRAEESLSKASSDRNSLIRNTADQVAEMKRLAALEIEEDRTRQEQQFESWRHRLLSDLNAETQRLMQSKIQAWKTRPVSKEMLNQWQDELIRLFENVVSGEGVKHEAVTTSTSVPSDEELSQSVIIPRAKKKRKQRLPFLYQGLAVIFVIGLAGFWYLRKPTPSNVSRGMPQASSKTLASSAHRKTASTPPPPPVVPSRPLTRTYKKSYTDNVLYTQSYIETEYNPDIRKRWTAELQKAARSEWHVSDKTIAVITAKESQLILDLQKIKSETKAPNGLDGVSLMRSRESTFKKELLALLNNQSQLVERYSRLKRAFFARNQFPADDSNR